MRFVLKIVLFLCVSFIWTSCLKENFDTSSSANIQMSSDTITFDTIFTSIGSVTKHIKLYNTKDDYLKISTVQLLGGSESRYRMNLDGQAGTDLRDVKIPPNDSLYLFIEVTLDPNGSDLPMVVKDSILIEVNGNQNYLKLIAFGQDVHLINGQVFQTQTWVNDKPYLVYNSMAVDTGHVLTLESGVRLHFHDKSSLIVWGQLQVNGSHKEPVVFEGDRFDGGYGRSAGRWGTIFIHPMSQGNVLNYAHIKNGLAGLQVGLPGPWGSIPSISISNSKIENSGQFGIYAFGAHISAYNTVVADARYYAMALLMGGEYHFYHTTISNLGAFESTVAGDRYLRDYEPSVLLSNWAPYYAYDENENIVELIAVNDLGRAEFGNSIIQGKRQNEIGFSPHPDGAFNFNFDHCLLQIEEDTVLAYPGNFHNIVLNDTAAFVNDSAMVGQLDFRLDTLSAAKDEGDIAISNLFPELHYDLEGKSRITDGKPDLGAYERYE